MNRDGYCDPTAEQAIKNVTQTPPEIMRVINLMKDVASLMGLEVIGRIQLRDKESGKEWR